MSENVQHYDVIIYGMGLQGLAAATQLMKNCPEKTMLLISPVDGVYPGTIATIGGQNYWDCQLLNNVSVHEKKESCQGGFFKYLFYPYKKYYNNIMMYDESYQLLLYLNFYNTLSKLGPAFHFNYNSDIVAVEKKDGRIESITVNHFERDDENMLRYISDTGYKVKGDIFIDASEDGKLARLADGAVTTGRYDWPEYLLDDVEKRSNGVGRQQAATLMVKVKGVNPFVAQSGVEKNFRTIFDQSSDGAWGADGEAGNYSRADSKVKLFNDTYGEQYGYAFKPFNAAQNGPQEDKAEADKEWWVNALMIFNVDGRAHERDRGLSCFPEYMIPGSKTTDQAYLDAREFLKGEGRTAFLDALHEWPGFEEAEFVIEGNQYSPFYNYPVTGDILYLRETVHMSTYTNNPDNDGEADYYQVPYWRSLGAGPDSSSGNDADCYNHRIGLVWYNPDIHPYKFSDLKNDEGEYIWWMDSYRHMRPDLVEEGYLPFENDAVPVNPMYFPYEGLLAHSVANLLIPGYACGCCSVSWGEVRVLSNLCVLGDAAGIAAAYCFYNNKHPKSLTDYDIKMIQNQLRTMKTYGDDMKFAAILEIGHLTILKQMV